MIDQTSGIIEAALDGLSARQRLIAQNIANVETPGYLAKRIDFEDSLRAAAVDHRDPGAISSSVSDSEAPTTPNGNNVHLDDEMVELVDTQLRYQLMTEAISKKLEIMRISIGGR